MNYRRRRGRGAVLVESIIVLSFFILCFLGIVYFKELYSAKIQAARIARAAAMAHAMQACKNDPAAGIQDDLPKKSRRQPVGSTSTERQPPIDTKGDKTADDALKDLERSKDGIPLVEITAIKVTGSAASVSKDDKGREIGFRSDEVTSASFVVCTDPVADDNYPEILPRIQGLFESLLKL